jgi:hypothetical protein
MNRPNLTKLAVLIKSFFKLRRIAEIATVLATLLALYQLFGGKSEDKRQLNNPIATPEQHSASIDKSIKSLNDSTIKNESTPTKILERSTIAINKYISRYNDKLNFGITELEVDDSSIIVNFYVENNSEKEVSVAIFKNMFLIDANKKQYEAETFESDRFSSIQSGVKYSGKIKFIIKSISGETYTLRSKFFVNDASAGDTTINIPFVIK